MSSRQTPRQPEREVRLHDSHPMHPHLAPPPTHAQGRPPPHLNGGPPLPPTPNGVPPTPVVPPHSSHHVSPIVGPAGPVNGVAVTPSTAKLAAANEETWLLIGRVAEQMGDLEHALSAYDHALRHNPNSLAGLTQVAGIARVREDYPKAVEFFQRALHIEQGNGEVWSALGHCYLMQDELQKAYAAYQQALYLLPNPKEDPRLWYGIGILYDRYGSLDHAEEAFSSVLRMDKVFTPDFDKANEILFRLGIIYKQQGKYNASLDCFDRILRNPPNPLAHADIWFQIGHVYEQQKDLTRAKDAYEHVVQENPNHSKVLQQLGWLYHQDGSAFQNQEAAISCLTKSLETDPSDAQSWYLLGRAYMAGQKYNKAYEAYQQAVYRDGRNPTFWCSIGVLYFQINQYRDALDAYSRAIRINPYISEVWFDLGSLYESCNNQISDAIDAYMRAAELDPQNTAITQRLQLLKNAQATGGALPAAPGPQDVHPTAYASSLNPPQGPPTHFQGGPRLFGNGNDRGPPPDQLLLPPPPLANGRMSSPPFGGRAPPPVILDDARVNPSHTPLAPMEVDRPPMGGRQFPPSRDIPSRGPGGPPGVLLHHPVPQPQFEPEALRNGHGPPHEPYRGGPLRPMSTSMSPPPPHAARARSPSAPFPSYGNRPPVGPGQANGGPPPRQRSPPPYGYEHSRPTEREQPWDRRAHPTEQWEREQREREQRERSRQMRHSGDYSSHGPPPHAYASRGQSPPPPVSQHRARSPRSRREPTPTSPRSPHPANGRGYWDPKLSGGPMGPQAMMHQSPTQPLHAQQEVPRSRYDPRFDAGGPGYDERVERSNGRSYASSPEGPRSMAPPPRMLAGGRSVSPSGSSVAAEQKPSRRRGGKDKDGEESVKKERKRRAPAKRVKEEPPRIDTLNSSSSGHAMAQPPAYAHGRATPGAASSNGSLSTRPSPSSGPGPQPPLRSLDEDYDEGVVETLMSLSTGANANQNDGPPSTGPPPSRGHRGSISSSHTSPPPTINSLKRPLSPHSDELDDPKRTRIEGPMRRRSSSGGRRTPVISSRPSPIPFRQQPSQPPSAGASPEISRAPGDPRMDSVTPHAFAPSPGIPAVLPPHPRPIGTGHSAQPMALPPIATLPQPTSPSSAAGSPGSGERDELVRPRTGETPRRSPPAASPRVQSRGPKLADMMHPRPASVSPTGIKHGSSPTFAEKKPESSVS